MGVGTRFLEEVEFLRARDRLGAVVKHQQDMFSVQIDFQAGNQRLAADPHHLKRLGNGGQNHVRVADRCKRNEKDPMRECVEQVGSYLQSQTGFASAARATQGQEMYIIAAKQATGCGHFSFAPNQRSELRWQIVGATGECLEWWKACRQVGNDELIDLLGAN